ncbi:2-C-methyl-D-erythritol 4-phosphate cytidylyltransferase [Spiroplasma tabanidicola]|uniref:2-C-methyl-D-erythritol 4-phosphate cytidylyltransferase n=1 Tax=Spiroplasma tabanidicola TaxID=324079 RepID=A0A6I6C3L3_9MOLU|nr:2-C-methyl-D-erythritol 4-phosphate cytidylyltransferase [Spiroplasma tabanidicola]QGS51387.1 2-C-methyl-D-erythritol 4-phosphate cytidylyltransferase [Spiroplasma tabanidicola]
MVDLIIVANGTGQRYGSNKLLEKIDERFVIELTIEKFINIEKIKNIIIVTNDEIKNILDNKYKNLILVKGGKTRSLSVQKGLNYVKSSFVMIHDGARPYVGQELINSLIENIKDSDGIIPILKITSCLKKIGDTIKTVNREEYVLSQTPQLFKTTSIKKEYANIDENWYDDFQALELKGYKLKTIIGEETNKKITFKKDIKS